MGLQGPSSCSLHSKQSLPTQQEHPALHKQHGQLTRAHGRKKLEVSKQQQTRDACWPKLDSALCVCMLANGAKLWPNPSHYAACLQSLLRAVSPAQFCSLQADLAACKVVPASHMTGACQTLRLQATDGYRLRSHIMQGVIADKAVRVHTRSAGNNIVMNSQLLNINLPRAVSILSSLVSSQS